jgi:hypothetical protein
MDSGNYESFWKADGTWDVHTFHRILDSTPHHLSFAYDNQSPPATVEALAQDVVAGVLRDQQKSLRTVIPIVHGKGSVLPDAVRRVAEDLFPIMIAVPERALGDGILARAATVRDIRTALNKTGIYIPLHLLGTGNPISLLIYTLAGADSFDGLEWCQTVVDHESGRLHHFQHWDFFAKQCGLEGSNELPYIQSVLLHNLIFYRRFLGEIQGEIAAGKGDALARRWLSDKILQRIMPILERKEK